MIRSLLALGTKVGSKEGTTLAQSAVKLTDKAATRTPVPPVHPEPAHAASRVQDAAHPHSETLSSAHLREAASATPHVVVDASRQMDWKAQLAKSSPALVGAGVAGVGAYWANERIGQIGAGVQNLTHELGDGVSTLAHNLPRPGDIEQKTLSALHHAQELVPLGEISGGVLTIGAILVGAIVVYEVVSRFSR